MPQDNETAEGTKQIKLCPKLTHVIYYVEPEIVAHVKLKDKLTPKEGEDVTRKVKASIEKTSQIKRVRHACFISAYA